MVSETTTPPAGTEARFMWLDPGDCEPYPDVNPRTYFDETALAELRASVEKSGVRQPLAVHDRGEVPKAQRRFWIVAGERRWRVGDAAGVQLPCLVATYTLAEALDMAALENLQRENLNPIEEARHFEKRVALGDVTQVEMAERYGVSPEHVSNRMRLLRLPEPVQELVARRRIMPSYARDMLLPWTSEEAQVAERFFRVLVQHLSFQQDIEGPFTKAWLADVVEKIGAVVKPKKVEAPKAAPPGKKPAKTSPPAKTEKSQPAAAPPPTATAEAGEAPPEPPPEPRASGDAEPPPAPAATADAQPLTPGVSEASCIHCGCTDSVACAEGCSWLAVDRARAVGICSQCGDAATAEAELRDWTPAAGRTPVPQPAAGPGPDTARERAPDPPPADSDAGPFAALEPLLGDYRVTITVEVPRKDGPVVVTVAPVRKDRKGHVTPRVIKRPASDIDVAVADAVRAFAAELTEDLAA